MLKLGELAKQYDVHVQVRINNKLLISKFNFKLQTHISENTGEIAFVKELYPDCKNYAEVYHKAKLLTNKVSIANLAGN